MNDAPPPLRLVLPKGRLQNAAIDLMNGIGWSVSENGGYRPTCGDKRIVIKLLKAANIPDLIELGAHDVGFTGQDWVFETGADVVELVDTGLGRVDIVAAAPVGFDPFVQVRGRPIIVASEYPRMVESFMKDRGVPYRYVRTYGATEVFPPEDADLIVDNCQTGSTLRANGLEILGKIYESSLRAYANRRALDDPVRKAIIDEMCLLLRGVLEARKRVLLDLNVPADKLEAVVAVLPAMKSPTIQPLYGDQGYAIRTAVPVNEVKDVILKVAAAGATDILQTKVDKVIA
ncbi:MAG: ATP phosphoribosyltransferase [Phycisphaerae bacterium]|nr:ATP phosphoribosyltransferase [Phycisphaerae bacterium]